MIEIVNVNKSWGIGAAGDLLINIPGDMKFFRETTRGSVCIMGSTTLDSFPGMRPLKNRVNIVLIDDEKKIRREALAGAAADKAAGLATELIYVRSLEEAVALGRRYEAGEFDNCGVEFPRKVFVIGGATIYRIMLPYCDTCMVTINDCAREADTYFPDLAADGQWEMTEEGEPQVYEAPEGESVSYRFTKWVRR